MGYRNDQFFNLPDTEGTWQNDPGSSWRDLTLYPPKNPPFIWPDRTIRAQGQTNTVLKRGYIRSLARTVQGTNFPIQKCQFQFNPSTLLQEVTQSEGMYNFLQQDPGQYVQPMPSSVNFGFELLFDRSMELNNAPRTPATFNTNEVNVWELSDPSEVGVLRDLSALFAAIGQGMSKDLRDYVQRAVTDSTLTVILRDNSTDTSSSSTTTSTSTTADSNPAQNTGDTTISGTDVPAFLDANVGNVAYLLPWPCRVVFSSLYIVEGLVSSTSVTFTKFNTAMVPMQCVVNVQMDAKYIGFAKKNTYLTWQLDQAKAIHDAEIKSDQDLIKSIYTALSFSASTMEVGLATGGVNPPEGPHDRWPDMPAGPANGESQEHYEASLKAFTFTSLERFIGGKFTGSKLYAHSRVPATASAMGDLFASSSMPISLASHGEIKISGPFTSVTPRSQQGLQVLAQSKGYLLSTTVDSNAVTTKNDWDAMRTNVTASAASSFPSTVNGDWYIIGFNSDITVTFSTETGGTQVILGEGSFWTVMSDLESAMTADGEHVLVATIPMRWPSYSPPVDTTTPSAPTVPSYPKIPTATTKSVSATSGQLDSKTKLKTLRNGGPQ